MTTLQTRMPLCAIWNRGSELADGGMPLSAAKGGKKLQIGAEVPFFYTLVNRSGVKCPDRLQKGALMTNRGIESHLKSDPVSQIGVKYPDPS
jgi:hypothetical protein